LQTVHPQRLCLQVQQQAAGAAAGAAACGAGCSAFAFVDVGEERVNANSVAFVRDDIAHHASCRRRHFDGDLIGFQLAQHFVNGDRITLVF
jgi:hypothetical protein